MNDDTLTFEQKIAVLFAYGFTVGVRDARFNTDYPGFYMVAEGSIAEIERDYDVPFADGANGPYCLVGDNLAELVDEALDLASNYDNFDAIVADIKAGGVGMIHTREVDSTTESESVRTHENSGDWGE